MKLVAALLAGLALAAGPGAAATGGVPRFRHVVVIVFENREYGQVLGSGEAPTFDALARSYAVLAGSRAVAHPSLPNYLALVSGSTHGIRTDCQACVVRGRSLADTLEEHWKTWKTYAEGIPRAGYGGPDTTGYAKKHVPFLYFRNVRASPARRARVVPLSALGRDLAAHRLPTFSLVVPDLCHSMHSCPVAAGDAWLHSFLPPLLRSSELQRSLVLVTFDEGTTYGRDGGRVPTLALGPLVRPGAVSHQPVNTYGLLRTIEDGLGLPALGESRYERPIGGIWR